MYWLLKLQLLLSLVSGGQPVLFANELEMQDFSKSLEETSQYPYGEVATPSFLCRTSSAASHPSSLVHCRTSRDTDMDDSNPLSLLVLCKGVGADWMVRRLVHAAELCASDLQGNRTAILIDDRASGRLIRPLCKEHTLLSMRLDAVLRDKKGSFIRSEFLQPAGYALSQRSTIERGRQDGTRSRPTGRSGIDWHMDRNVINIDPLCPIPRVRVKHACPPRIWLTAHMSSQQRGASKHSGTPLLSLSGGPPLLNAAEHQLVAEFDLVALHEDNETTALESRDLCSQRITNQKGVSSHIRLSAYHAMEHSSQVQHLRKMMAQPRRFRQYMAMAQQLEVQ